MNKVLSNTVFGLAAAGAISLMGCNREEPSKSYVTNLQFNGFSVPPETMLVSDAPDNVVIGFHDDGAPRLLLLLTRKAGKQTDQTNRLLGAPRRRTNPRPNHPRAVSRHREHPPWLLDEAASGSRTRRTSPGTSGCQKYSRNR